MTTYPDESIRPWAAEVADACEARGLVFAQEALVWREIAKCGAEYLPVPRPRSVRLMAARACFRNSALTVFGRTAVDNSRLEYIEGFAVSATTGFWVHHAWVSDEQGHVLDRTWPVTGERYIGVPLLIHDDASIWDALDGRERNPGADEFGHCQLLPFCMTFAFGPTMVG